MSADPNSTRRHVEPAAAGRDANWSRRFWVAAVLAVVVVVAGFAASATIPRWWAHRVGEQVDGSITQGILVGLFYGFVFTLLPLAILTVVFLYRRTLKWLVAGLVLALVAAAPNLMTLGIVLGSGNAAHAGERTLDVEAPSFRGATLVGALAAVALVLFVSYLVLSRRRARARESDVRSRLESATAPEPKQPSDR